VRAEFEALCPKCPNATNLSGYSWQSREGKVMISSSRNGAKIFR
jgi:hypothetical protein